MSIFFGLKKVLIFRDWIMIRFLVGWDISKEIDLEILKIISYLRIRLL